MFCKEGKYKQLDKYSIIYKFHRVDITDFKIIKKKSEILDYKERHRIIEPLYL
jgi:RIO-like serine/threonine protein kinase